MERWRGELDERDQNATKQLIRRRLPEKPLAAQVCRCVELCLRRFVAQTGEGRTGGLLPVSCQSSEQMKHGVVQAQGEGAADLRAATDRPRLPGTDRADLRLHHGNDHPYITG